MKNRLGEGEDPGLRELVKSVTFVSVDVGHGNTELGVRRDRTTFGILRFHESLVEKFIHGTMLGLLGSISKRRVKVAE